MVHIEGRKGGMAMRRGMVVLAVLAACVVWWRCENVDTEEPTQTVTLADMAIDSSDIQGWRVNETINYASVADLAGGAFNGEAYYYANDLGLSLLRASFQDLTGPSPSSAGVYVLEFGSAANAATAYSDRRQQQINDGSQLLALAGYDASTATLFKLGVDYLVYATVDRFLIKLGLYGPGGDTQAQTQALQFMGFYSAAAH
jgi:hypothetical protein